MFIKLISKPILLYTLLYAMLGATLSLALSLFLPSQSFLQKSHEENVKQSNFKVVKAFDMQIKKRIITKRVVKKEYSQIFLLKAFAITAIFTSKDEKMVMAKGTKGGVFIYLNKSYKGYKLVEVLPKKAKFKKGVNYYWSFLNPEDEKKFKKHAPTASTSTVDNSPVRDTVAVEMFEKVKFKNGKYFVPRSILNDFSNLGKIFSSISIQAYNINSIISYKVTRVRSSSLFSKLGIKYGDMIMAVNNKKFTSINEPLKLFANIKNVKQLSITVERSGKTKELKYEIY